MHYTLDYAMSRIGRRGLLRATTGGIAFGALAGISSGHGRPPYEVWAADQGTDTLYVYRPHKRGRDHPEWRKHDVVSLGEYGIETPHMLHFSSDYKYAVTANTGSGDVAVLHAPSRRVLDVLDTGPGSHFAGFSPNDEYIHVDVIGNSEIVRINADLRLEEFEIDDRIQVNEDIDGLTEEGGAPICHDYDHQGRSMHTLGPSYHNGGVVIVDHTEFEVVNAWSGNELPANCGTIPHPTEHKFYLTAGLPSAPDEGEEGVGEFYVLDTTDDSIRVAGESTHGIDAHGVWPTVVDGERELWIVNRETNDGVIVDMDNDEVKKEIESFGPVDDVEPEDSDAPDILWTSPDERYMFGTLRGPNPVSGDPHAATGVNPGFAVWDVAGRERVSTITPDVDNDNSDFHGIAVRPVNGSATRGR